PNIEAAIVKLPSLGASATLVVGKFKDGDAPEFVIAAYTAQRHLRVHIDTIQAQNSFLWNVKCFFSMNQKLYREFRREQLDSVNKAIWALDFLSLEAEEYKKYSEVMLMHKGYPIVRLVNSVRRLECVILNIELLWSGYKA